jgi:hypothetical protein
MLKDRFGISDEHNVLRDILQDTLEQAFIIRYE